MMPALYSHFVGATSVHDVASAVLRNQFQRRPTTQAVAELDQLTVLLQDVTLSTEADDRLLAGLIYKASTRGDHQCASYTFVWCNFAPPRVKFFGWLLTQNRILCQTALVHKNILDDARRELCWSASGVAKVSELWNTQPPPRIAKAVLNPLLLLLCWEIWKHRK
jgi:hypothetical protein